jgi:hypothetical protein
MCGSVTFFVLDSVLYRPYSNELESCKYLSLFHLQLTMLRDGVFAGLSSLQGIYLSYSQLTTLPDGVFAGLSSLQELHLYNNRLTTLPFRIFSGLLLTSFNILPAVMSCPEGSFFPRSFEEEARTPLMCLPCPAGSFSDGKIPVHISLNCAD